MCHEIVEVRTAFLIEYHNLTIQNGALPLESAQDLLKKRINLTELVPFARHQPGLLAIDIQGPAKAVVL